MLRLLKKSITRKFMILYFIVGVSSLSMIGFYAYYKARNALVMRATEQLNSVKAFKKAQVEFFLQHLDNSANINIPAQDSLPNSMIAVIKRIMLDTLHTNGLGKTGEVYLVGSNFRMLSPSRFPGFDHTQIVVNTPAARTAITTGNGSLTGPDYRGRKCLSSFDVIQYQGIQWAILAEIDYDEALIPIRILRNDLIFISIIILVLIFSIAQVINNDIILPIHRLKALALAVSRGETDTRVHMDNENEMGLLARTFNQMLDSLQIHTRELLDEKARRVSALYDGQEFERHRISRELHDGLAQELIAIKLSAENILSRKGYMTEAGLQTLREQLSHALDELRKISQDLAPSGIMEFSFETAVKILCSQVEHAASLPVDFSWHGDFTMTGQRTKIYLYRIIQEALGNVMKHSGASQVHIQMTETQENIVLMIEDNGKGFHWEPCCLDYGKGLFNIRERCNLLGGSFDVETAPGQGTTLRIKVKKNA